MSATSDITNVEFFFDPNCPWTWATSRWLIEATEARGITITWRSLSLGVLNAGREVPEQYRAAMEAGKAAHRMIVAMGDAGRNDLIGAVYTEYGRHVHHDHEMPTADAVQQWVTDAGAGEFLAVGADESLDARVEASTAEAMSLAGPDVGSPVLAFGEPRVGMFGPIVSPPPTGDDALRLLDVVLDGARIPGFYELKRGRSGPPQQGPRP